MVAKKREWADRPPEPIRYSAEFRNDRSRPLEHVKSHPGPVELFTARWPGRQPIARDIGTGRRDRLPGIKKDIGTLNHAVPGFHESLVAERNALARDLIARHDLLQIETGRQAGWLALAAAILLASLILFVAASPSPGTVLTPLEQTGEIFAAGMTALILALSLVFTCMGLSGLGLLTGIFSRPPSSPHGLYFNLAQAAGLQTSPDIPSTFQTMTREEISAAALQAITRQRKSLARQARALQRGRFFLLLALIPWLVALAFRLFSIFR